MTENSGFAAYAMFHALKLHFTSSSYDYFKYNGKTNVTKTTFSTRKDKYQFYKLSRRYGLEDLKNFYVANFIADDITWVGDLMTPQAEEVHKKWQKRIQSLTYIFKDDMIRICEQSNDLDALLKVESGNLPPLLHGWMSNEICIETMAILDDILNFIPMWDKKIDDDIIWPKYRDKLLRYKPFLSYDKKVFRNNLKEIIKEYAEA